MEVLRELLRIFDWFVFIDIWYSGSVYHHQFHFITSSLSWPIRQLEGLERTLLIHSTNSSFPGRLVRSKYRWALFRIRLHLCIPRSYRGGILWEVLRDRTRSSSRTSSCRQCTDTLISEIINRGFYFVSLLWGKESKFKWWVRSEFYFLFKLLVSEASSW